MKKENNTCKKLMKSAASAIIRREMDKWPPDCFGFSYQPMRPEKAQDSKKVSKQRTNNGQ